MKKQFLALILLGTCANGIFAAAAGYAAEEIDRLECRHGPVAGSSVPTPIVIAERLRELVARFSVPVTPTTIAEQLRAVASRVASLPGAEPLIPQMHELARQVAALSGAPQYASSAASSVAPVLGEAELELLAKLDAEQEAAHEQAQMAADVVAQLDKFRTPAGQIIMMLADYDEEAEPTTAANVEAHLTSVSESHGGKICDDKVALLATFVRQLLTPVADIEQALKACAAAAKASGIDPTALEKKSDNLAAVAAWQAVDKATREAQIDEVALSAALSTLGFTE